MRYAAAYILATLAGNTNPDVQTISKILGSVGIDCDETKAKKVIAACKGKDIETIIAEGSKKLSSMPSGGGGVAAASAAAPVAEEKKPAGKEHAKKEEKKEKEKEKEESGDEDGDMGFGLFD